jgi:hypothetical protein
VEFCISHGEQIRLLRSCGLVVDDLVEIRPPDGAYSDFGADIPLGWARDWPTEEVWFAHRP